MKGFVERISSTSREKLGWVRRVSDLVRLVVGVMGEKMLGGEGVCSSTVFFSVFIGLMANVSNS